MKSVKVTVTKITKTLRSLQLSFSDGDNTYYARLTVKAAEEIIDELRRDSKYSAVAVVRQ